MFGFLAVERYEMLKPDRAPVDPAYDFAEMRAWEVVARRNVGLLHR
jgi:hypothetical protein